MGRLDDEYVRKGAILILLMLLIVISLIMIKPFLLSIIGGMILAFLFAPIFNFCLKFFKNKTLTNQDKMIKKLDILLTEKKVREYQEEKEKRLWAIIIKALKEHRILSSKELEEIAQLEIF